MQLLDNFFFHHLNRLYNRKKISNILQFFYNFPFLISFSLFNSPIFSISHHINSTNTRVPQGNFSKFYDSCHLCSFLFQMPPAFPNILIKRDTLSRSEIFVAVMRNEAFVISVSVEGYCFPAAGPCVCTRPIRGGVRVQRG